jgi:hypothetical protein
LEDDERKGSIIKKQNGVIKIDRSNQRWVLNDRRRKSQSKKIKGKWSKEQKVIAIKRGQRIQINGR